VFDHYRAEEKKKWSENRSRTIFKMAFRRFSRRRRGGCLRPMTELDPEPTFELPESGRSKCEASKPLGVFGSPPLARGGGVYALSADLPTHR
jgi:hypothetical protein